MTLILFATLPVLLAFLVQPDGMQAGAIAFAMDFTWWWHHDTIPIVTNPDAYASTVAAPWFGKGRVTH